MWSPSPEQWKQVEPLVDELLDMEETGRSAFIERSFSHDPHLREWVDRLLAGIGNAAFLDRPGAEFLSEALRPDQAEETETNDPLLGTTFGPFRILHEIGHGGMGRVYLAEREGGSFEQRVALKVISSPLLSTSLRQRFMAEQRALARLEHPNVARLVDGGVRDDGLPWFAMEYVEGVRLDAWCDERRLDLRARLLLFLSVCDAVQAAHQRLVIHRDLKPSNILVTTTSEVRLLDFGVAKLLGGDDGEADDTRAGERLFTPEYAAPEQWRHEPVTSATDCYALGVIFYQLVCGARPHDLRSRPRESWMRIVEEEPARPASALATAEAATARGLTLSGLLRTLRGDLDAIALAAVRPDPTVRYQTVRQFADDVRRFLDAMPVRAREGRWTYHVSRFVRRHRTAVGLAATAMLAIVGGAMATASEARKARAAAEEATAVSSFLRSLFVEAAPEQTRGDSITAGEMLQRAAAGVDSMFAGKPQLQVQVLLTVYEINRDLGAVDRADTLVRKAVAIADSAIPRSMAAIMARATLGEIQRIRGELPLADSAFRRAIDDAQDIGAPDTTLARLYGAWTNVLYRMQRFDDAAAASRQAYQVGAPLGPVFLGQSAGNVAAALDAAGKDDEAGREFERAARHFASPELATNPEHLMLLGNWSALLEERWELDSARMLKERVLPLLSRVYANGHDRVVIARSNAAYTALRLEQAAAAESGFTAAYEMAVRLHDDKHFLAIVTSTNIGRARLAAGQWASAETVFRDVLTRVRAGVGGQHAYASAAWFGIARAAAKLGRTAEGLVALDSAAAIARSALPPTHVRHAEITLARGEYLLDAGRVAEAEPLLREGLEQFRQRLSPRDPQVAEAAFLLARALALAAGPGSTQRQSEIVALCREAASRYAQLPSRARARASVDSALAVWRREGKA